MLLTYEERAKALHDNPVLAARMFKSRIDNVLKYILRGGSHPLGILTDWWLRVEFQTRGSLHVHAILWALLHFRLGHKEWWNVDDLTGLLSGDLLRYQRTSSLGKLLTLRKSTGSCLQICNSLTTSPTASALNRKMTMNLLLHTLMIKLAVIHKEVEYPLNLPLLKTKTVF